MFAEVFSYDREIYDRGLEWGAYEKAVETAQRLLSMGLSIDQIMKGTELSE